MDIGELHFQHHPMLDDMDAEERYSYLLGLLQCYFIVGLIISVLVAFSVPY